MQWAPLAGTSRSLVVAGHHVTQHSAGLFEQLDKGWLRSVPRTELLHQDLLALAGMGDQGNLEHVFGVIGNSRVQEKLFFVLVAQSDYEEYVSVLRVNCGVVSFSRLVSNSREWQKFTDQGSAREVLRDCQDRKT